MPIEGAGRREISQAGVGPVEQGVKNPLFSTQGENFASQFLIFGEGATTTGQARPGKGAGLGLALGGGVGLNNGQKQYYFVVRAFAEPTPNQRGTLITERITADDPIVGRKTPTVTFTAATVPFQLKGEAGPVNAKVELSATASKFLNPEAGVNVNFAGATGVLSVGSDNRTHFTYAKSKLLLDNKQKLPSKAEIERMIPRAELELLRRDGIGARQLGFETGTRALPSVDKNHPALITDAVALGVTATNGKPLGIPLLGQGSVTVTIPENRVRTSVKSFLDRVEAAQRYPDKRQLLQLMADFKASPKLMAEFQDWTQQEFNKTFPAQQPPPQPESDWLSKLGGFVSGLATGWVLPGLEKAGEGLIGLLRLLGWGSGGQRI